MRYPTISDIPARKVSVPQLSGGINKTDNPSYINDNQLTECNNMWFAGGRLRTRPGITYKGSIGDGDCLDIYNDGEKLFALLQSGPVCIEPNNSYNFSKYGIDMNSGFITRINKQLQGNDGEVVCIGDSGGLEFTDWKAGTQLALSVSRYIPTLMINANPTDDPSNAQPNGYVYQGANLLSDSFKIVCNAPGDSVNGWAWMLPDLGGKRISTAEIEYYDKNKHYTEIPVANDTGGVNSVDVTVCVDGVYKTVQAYFGYYPSQTNAKAIVVWTKGADGEYRTDTAIHASLSNGLIITVNVDTNDADNNVKKISSMTMGRWFGGARGGLENGTRLFVAGGVEEGIIRWSDLNRPNYFSENNYAYVGDGSKITALAQQDDMLVIFQEHAITYATYVEGIGYTAADIQNENTVDVTTLSATFPLTTIHSEVGCDCPDTVRLCNNRLVWLTSAGKVYCLVNNSQYNERNVREISYAIEWLLKKHTAAELKAAKSADVGGMYFLFVEKKIYVLDYANTSFEYYTYQAHEKRLKNYLSWYVWTLPEYIKEVKGADGVGDHLCIIADALYGAEGEYISNAVFDVDLNIVNGITRTDNFEEREDAIPCSLRTKLYAFSGAERMKRIPNCNISLCKIPGEVEISFVTDNGSGTTRYVTIDEEANESDLDAVKRMTLYPNANNTSLFGIDIRSESAMAVEGISITYKEMRDKL